VSLFVDWLLALFLCTLCRQTRKLQEMVKALQQENEDLKRRFACGGGCRSAGSGGGMHTAGGVQLSTSGRQPSPFGSGPMQMVSTGTHHSVASWLLTMVVVNLPPGVQ
jgi:hypothetical protein